MSFYLVKQKNGSYSPCDDSDFEASKGIGTGTIIKATAPRNFKFHKKAMALLELGHENQERYESFNVYRKVITIRAGFFQLTDIDNNEIPLADSLSFEAMSAETFSKWYNATLEVIASDIDSKPDIIRQEIDSFY